VCIEISVIDTGDREHLQGKLATQPPCFLGRHTPLEVIGSGIEDHPKPATK
jgi:hypothetical protein